jgi:putative transposase
MPLYQNKYRVKSARLQGWDYRSPGWYFVTICTEDHRHIFGDVSDGQVRLSPSGEIADSELRNLSSHYLNISLDTFVVMPNHIHAIIVIEGQHRHFPNPIRSEPCSRNSLIVIPPKAGSLAAIVRSYKSGVTYRCHEKRPRDFAWQAGFYDYIIRTNIPLQAIREYIEQNPANWPEDPENRPSVQFPNKSRP